MTSWKADEAPVAFQVGTSRFQTWDCSQELRPGHINQLSAGLQGLGKTAVARNAPGCTDHPKGEKPSKPHPDVASAGLVLMPIPRASMYSCTGRMLEAGISHTGILRDRLSRPVTDSQA